jgi:putative flippase GtrA
VKDFLLSKKQFLLYCVIGASGVGLHGLLYCYLVKTGMLKIQPANGIGYASGTLLTFFLNAKFNFKTNDKTLLRLLSFGSVAFGGWLVSAVTLHLLVDRFGINKIFALFPTLFIVVFLQYNLNRLVSFRKSSLKTDASRGTTISK